MPIKHDEAGGAEVALVSFLGGSSRRWQIQNSRFQMRGNDHADQT